MKKLLLIFSIVACMGTGKLYSQITFFVENPPSLVGPYDFTYVTAQGGWGHDIDTMNRTGFLALVDDGTPEDSLGCEPLINGAAIAGKIAVLYRGSCEFGTKAFNAQNAGAIAVIIINNGPGGPVGMAPGTDGGNVTIPVIMISDADGALLKPAIDDGTAEAFIGNKTQLYPNDLSFLSEHLTYSHTTTLPEEMADSTFYVPVQGWVYNLGYEEQPNVILSASITLDGNPTPIYQEVSASGTNLLPGDSIYIVLPDFAQNSYNVGRYSLTYTISSDSTDNFPADNTMINDFWINSSNYYSKVRFDQDNNPISNGSIGFIIDQEEFRSCIVMDVKNANGMNVFGMSFATIRSEGPVEVDLTDATVIAQFYRWEDNITPSNITFNELVDLATEFYIYPDNLQNEYVSVDFVDSIPLQDNTRYLACVNIDQMDDNDVRLGADRRHDYLQTVNVYLNEEDYSVLFPFEQVGDGWFLTWSWSTAPAIVVNMERKTSVNVTETVKKTHDIKPYPNPANHNINIPLSNVTNGAVELQVYDIQGKLVQTEMINMSSEILNVNTNNLGNGTYFFKLRFEDNNVSSFPVMISR